MKYFIVDAFSDVAFGGNPAGVVLLGDNDFPSEKFMRQVAAEFRYSETAFVKQNDVAEFTVRYFTPVWSCHYSDLWCAVQDWNGSQ